MRHQGVERVICCWRIGDVLVDPGPESALLTLLAALGDAPPRALLLTHIHLDHAGATGALVRRWPDLDVYVHERGAPHMVDPSRLIRSAEPLFGGPAAMRELWGEVVPVPQERITVLQGGETLSLDDVGAGRVRVAYTPGHASHHVSYLHEDSGLAIVGDMAGVRIPPATMTIAPTPPPDIDVEAWEASLEAIADWAPSALGLTHFGRFEDVEAQLAATRDSLRELAELTRTAGAEVVERTVRERYDALGDAALIAAYERGLPPDHVAAGLERYWRKRAERER